MKQYAGVDNYFHHNHSSRQQQSPPVLSKNEYFFMENDNINTNKKDVTNTNNENLQSRFKSQSDDDSVLEVTDRIIGEGSFGRVVVGKMDNKEYAIKICGCSGSSNNNKEIKTSMGIQGIIEPIIMASIVHPNIASAICTICSDNEIYIVQEKAEIDLMRKRRSREFSFDELRYHFYCLACAIQALHHNNIIHADIKASNILYFRDGTIKLTDFTLSRKKEKPTTMFTGRICTNTHRPPECFLGENWNEAVDIWSLGCTMFELTYGIHLFQYQGELENNKDKYINNISDWIKDREGIILRQRNIRDEEEYKKYLLPSMFKENKYSDINDLIVSMLTLVSNRPTIDDVLKHKLFKNINSRNISYNPNSRYLESNEVTTPPQSRLLPIHYMLEEVKKRQLSDREAALLRIVSDEFSLVKKDGRMLGFVDLVATLYSKIDIPLVLDNIYMKNNDDDNYPYGAIISDNKLRDILIACVLIVCKIHKKRHSQKLKVAITDDIIKIEREICHTLSFKLLEFEQ